MYCNPQVHSSVKPPKADSKSWCAPRVTRISSPSSAYRARPQSDGYAGATNRSSRVMCSIETTSSSKPKSWSYDNGSGNWPALSVCCSHSFEPSISGSTAAVYRRVTRRLDYFALSTARRMFSRHEGRCGSCVCHLRATINGGVQSRRADSTTNRAVRGRHRPS